MNERGGQNLRELGDGLDMSRQSVSKHLAVLESALLVTTVRRGREKLHYLNAAPINDIAERWINHYHRGRIGVLADLKRALEDDVGDRTEFVYTTYIETTAERLWRALTDPVFTARWWEVTFETDWQPGSTMTWKQRGITTTDGDQVVLEAEPFRRLSYTWHTYTSELAAAYGFDDDHLAKVRAESRSKVTFEIEPQETSVKLTVVHDGFDPQSVVLASASGGWPRVLSTLKTLLESPEAVPTH